MELVIVPNSLRDAINRKIDIALKGCPEAEVERDQFYERLLTYFDEYGVIPDFTLQKKGQGAHECPPC